MIEPHFWIDASELARDPLADIRMVSDTAFARHPAGQHNAGYRNVAAGDTGSPSAELRARTAPGLSIANSLPPEAMRRGCPSIPSHLPVRRSSRPRRC